MTAASSLVLVAIVACATPTVPPVATPPPAPTAAPARDPDAFGIAPLEIYIDEVMVMQMGRDGVVKIRRDGGPMVPSFTLSEDGTIASVDGPRGAITSDGRVRSPGGQMSRFRLDGEMLALGGRQLHLDEGGTLQVDGPGIGGRPPRAAGVVDRASRRTALLLLGMVLDAGL